MLKCQPQTKYFVMLLPAGKPYFFRVFFFFVRNDILSLQISVLVKSRCLMGKHFCDKNVNHLQSDYVFCQEKEDIKC